ncbi:hypothetical protein VPNG_03962 [Cytospora leucostoma]|uniref:DUF1996 domain-containing protein n=1 Tax=Cytospora leucostoma TaxID=1230097 RepID=A0A423XDV4_9PEZI|nr:hypothetical protein VPNG_03962 [Cytospora leucostoma]
MRYSPSILTALAATAHAARDARTFAVLRFYGDGPLMEGRVDPIVSPGETATHVHTIMGGSAMGVSATGESMLASNCSNALVEGDNSGYWVPKLYFHDRDAGTLEPVDLFYMNVYYFFEPTDDDVAAFPAGLQIVSGDASLRTCPDFGGVLRTDGANGTTGTQPTQWTCPRSSYSPPSRPPASESDGSRAGIQDPSNAQAGQGFPFAECDGYASPLRQDLHLPSCYDQSKGLDDYAGGNMVFPTADYPTGKQNCPAGFLHVPHLFFETYWNTPLFRGRWAPGEGYQPFVLANGDLTGCSAHGDFLAAWDTEVLQGIIDTCDAGDVGMDTCPGVTVRDKAGTCNVASPIKEDIVGNLTALPGDNPLVGWGLEYSSSTGGGSGSGSVSSSASSPAASGYSTVSSASAGGTVAVSPHSSHHHTSSPSSASAAASTYPAAVALADSDGSGDDSNQADVVSPSPADISTPTSAVAQDPLTTASVTTLPNGDVSTVWDTIFYTVTITATVYETEAPSARKERGIAEDGRGHGHGHEHLLRHRSPHGRLRR